MTRAATQAASRFTVWGSRGQRNLLGAPSRFGTLTPCCSLRAGADLFVFDAGKGLARLSGALHAPGELAGVERVHVLISHAHVDHWEGLRDARWFWAPDALAVTLRGPAEALDAIAAAHQPPAFQQLEPLATDTLRHLRQEPLIAGQRLQLGAATLEALPLRHHDRHGEPVTTLGYRLELADGPVVAYLSDHAPAAGSCAEERLLGHSSLALLDSHFLLEQEHAELHGSLAFAARLARQHPAVLVVAGHLGDELTDAAIDHAWQSLAVPNLALAVEGSSWEWDGRGWLAVPPADPLQDLRRQTVHDLRARLNHIIGYTELLLEEVEDGCQTDLQPDLRRIRDAAHGLLEQIARVFAAGSPLLFGARPSSAPQPAVAHGASASQAAASAPEAAGPRAVASPLEAVGTRAAAEDAATQAVAEPPAAVPARQQRAASETGRLLIVDDDAANRELLLRRLRACGYEAVDAESGPAALSLLDERSFDLMLLDVMMPGMSGVEVLLRVRERWSAADLPIIMATARDDSQDIVEALRLGANDYVIKPLDFPVVLARVQTQLRLKKLTDDLEVRNRFIRQTFGRYLSDEVVADLLASPAGLELGGERRRVTLLMSDLRGFTGITERLHPEQVLELLNGYLGAMADVIFAHGGMIDEFIGDSILAIFGVPTVRDDDATRALACAIAMQRAMSDVNERHRRSGFPALQMGIAVHTGDVVVGNIGSSRRAKYGVVGSLVTLASRIESFTVGHQILTSADTLQVAGASFQIGEGRSVHAKGFKKPITVHDVLGMRDRPELRLARCEEPLRRLSDPLAVEVRLVRDKVLEEERFAGRITSLSAQGAELVTSAPAVLWSNIVFRLVGADGRLCDDGVQGKVLGVEPGGRLRVRFTAVPDPEAQVLGRLHLRARG